MRSRTAIFSDIYQILFNILIVGDDTIVNADELVLFVGSLWVRIDRIGFTVGGPTCMSNTDMNGEFSVPIDILQRWKVRRNSESMISSPWWSLLTFHDVFEFFDFSLLSNDDTGSFGLRWGILIVFFNIIPIEGNTRRIITTIFQSMKSIDENISDEPAIAFDQIIQISENTLKNRCSTFAVVHMVQHRLPYHTCLLLFLFLTNPYLVKIRILKRNRKKALRWCFYVWHQMKKCADEIRRFYYRRQRGTQAYDDVRFAFLFVYLSWRQSELYREREGVGREKKRKTQSIIIV